MGGQAGASWDILRKVKIPREDTFARMYDVPFVLERLQDWVKDNPDVGQYMDLSTLGMSGHSLVR